MRTVEWRMALHLEMDLERQEIANLEELKANPTAWGLANAVAAESGQEEWNQLRRIYWFTHEQETWVIDDQYCCNPKCPCQEAVLSFIRPPQGAERGPLRPTLSISYRYRDGKVSRLDAEKNARYSEQGLLELLKKARADLDSLLAKRQSLLRRLCGRGLKTQTIQSPTPKIGRNDPCPCGSGKKWKRCCGA